MIPNFIKKVLHFCSVAIGAVVALPLLTGCSSDGSVPDNPGIIEPIVEPDKGRVTLDLSIGINNGSNAATRAFNPNDDGTFENPISDYEKVHTLRVVIVRHKVNQDDTEDLIIEHNRMVTVRDGYTDVINNHYIINDNLQFNVVAPEMKTIYLFANEKGAKLNKSTDEDFDFTKDLVVGKPFPSEKVNNLLITRKVNAAFIDNGTTTPLADKCYIPMSESFDVKVPAATGNTEDFYSKSLFLTRSLIKFSFCVTLIEGDISLDEIENYGMKLAGVKISNLADASYFLPRDTKYEPYPKYYFEGEDFFDLSSSSQPPVNPDRWISSFSVPEQSSFSTCTFMFDQPLEITKGGKSTSPLIYLPESKNEEGYMLSLLFDSDELNDLYGSKPLRFRLNDINDTSWENTTDIPRNTHVKINIAILLNRQSLEATVTVFPYTAVNLNPEFGFTPPETDHLTVAPTMELQLNGEDGLLYPKFESDKGNTIQNLYWVSSNPSIVLLGNEVTDETDQRYIEPSSSIELSYLQEVQDKLEPVPVRVIPKGVGTTNVTVYTQSGLVARCRVTVK